MAATPINGNAGPVSTAANGWAQAQRHGEGLRVSNYDIRPVQTFPDLAIYDIPEGIPDNVSDAVADGNHAMEGERWRPAVASYATALDFACNKLLDGEHLEKPLGGKLTVLSGNATLPPALLEFMRAVNLDRVSALHYPGAISAETAEAVRTLTITILEYLFSLPKQIQEAQKRLADAKQKP